MGSKRFWVGIVIMALVFGMAVVGCDLTDDDDLNGTWGSYIVKGSKYSDVKLQIKDGNWEAKKYNGSEYVLEAKGTAYNGIATTTHRHGNYWDRTWHISSLKYDKSKWYSKEEAKTLFNGISVVDINGEEVKILDINGEEVKILDINGKEVKVAVVVDIIRTSYDEFTYSVKKYSNKLTWDGVIYIRN